MMKLVPLAAAAALFALPALAQQPSPTPTPSQQPSANAGQNQAKVSKEAMTFAKKVASSNMFEIKSSEMAQEKAQSAEIKSFAQQMISDHHKAGEDFNAALQQASITLDPNQIEAKHQKLLQKLGSAQGAAFDKLYINDQLQAHREAVNLFRTYSRSGKTQALKDFAQKTLPTLEQHLEMIQGISRKGVAQSTPKR